MTCSILSAIIASTKVANWARKPGWRIAAKDRLAGGEAPAETGLISFMKNHQFAGVVQGSPRGIRQREARQGSGKPNGMRICLIWQTALHGRAAVQVVRQKW